jgi:hypothetical protein
MAESTILTACSIATFSVLVTMSPEIAWMISRTIAHHGLSGRVATVNYLDPGLDEVALSAAIENPDEFLTVFTEAARRGVEQFGDVIIPAEGIMNEILVAHGVQEIDGISVMDSSAVTWLHAEYMVKLARTTGLHPGRRWDYAQLDGDTRARLRRQNSTNI